jgi:hypothetical protein
MESHRRPLKPDVEVLEHCRFLPPPPLLRTLSSNQDLIDPEEFLQNMQNFPFLN